MTRLLSVQSSASPLARSVPAALLLAATVACGAGVADPVPPEVPGGAVLVPTEPFPDAIAPFRFYSGLAHRERLVVRDQATWAALWNQIVANVSPTPPVPAVDFARQAAIVVASGGRPSGGYGIAVQAAYRTGEALYVVVRETSPGKDCVVTQALTAPLAAVLVPAPVGAPRFVERTSTIYC